METAYIDFARDIQRAENKAELQAVKVIGRSQRGNLAVGVCDNRLVYVAPFFVFYHACCRVRCHHENSPAGYTKFPSISSNFYITFENQLQSKPSNKHDRRLNFEISHHKSCNKLLS